MKPLGIIILVGFCLFTKYYDSLQENQGPSDEIEPRNLYSREGQADTSQKKELKASNGITTTVTPSILQPQNRPLEPKAVSGPTSHKIIASGWPSTSPLWPSLQTTFDSRANATLNGTATEPFIYVDNPRLPEFGLILKTNGSLLERAKFYSGQPASLNLSFDYFFNHELKLTALPGIKIEVDRHQHTYLEPNGQSIKAAIWSNFDALIPISNPEAKFETKDWIRIAFVNRQAKSLVAIRRLKAEITFEKSKKTDSVGDAKTSKTKPSKDTETELEESAEESDPSDVKELAASTTTEKSHKWLPGGLGKRHKREAATTGKDKEQEVPRNITLACFKTSECDWTSETNEQLQWSLARMPPSIERVQLGYYHVSNQQGYGDPQKMLYLSLNETETATQADTNSDHCIELAIYVTESTYLNLFQFTRANQNAEWQKGNHLLTWAPTVGIQLNKELDSGRLAANKRQSLSQTPLASLAEGQNGWTFETLCYGDFFDRPIHCGSGRCAFGFEMQSDLVTILQRAQKESGRSENDEPEVDLQVSSNNEEPPTAALRRHTTYEELSRLEQVVAIGLLRDFATNKPIRIDPLRWLQAWEREEISPNSNWNFYPGMDYQISANYVSLTNLFNDARYFVVSDWIAANRDLDFLATLRIENMPLNQSGIRQAPEGKEQQSLLLKDQTIDLDGVPLELLDSTQPQLNNYRDNLFRLNVVTRLVDANYKTLCSDNATIYWPPNKNSSNYSLNFSGNQKLDKYLDTSDLRTEGRLFKIILEFTLDCSSNQLDSWGRAASGTDQDSHVQSVPTPTSNLKLILANISLSDRCHPSPCLFGRCNQIGTLIDNWECHCDDKHRGRKCEFGRWCQIAHITPWVPKLTASSGSRTSSAVILKAPIGGDRKPKIAIETVTLISGREYCRMKLGSGANCTDIDLALNEQTYTEDEITFSCTCQDNFYLGDDAKCREAHLCNSIVCNQLGTFCDETKPFNKHQPCKCNQAEGWFPDPLSSPESSKCVRNQCRDKMRDCQFNAHICIPTLPSEKPICKCGANFALKVNENGVKSCQSTACVLPTLNDCEHICQPNNENLLKPYTCSCHPGWTLSEDGHSCRPARVNEAPICSPSCNKHTQICTDFGCKCKQGYLPEAPKITQIYDKTRWPNGDSLQTPIDYTSSVKCLNICELKYAENKAAFQEIESVCPLGLCDPNDFTCKCFDSTSSALINSKYERFDTIGDSHDRQQAGGQAKRSPLCRLKRVCQADSIGSRVCKSQGAICVPDYTKQAMFDCVCPPSTEKRPSSSESSTSSEFKCESKCTVSRSDCLRRMAVCRLMDKDQTKCDCLPGFMLSNADQKCYLAKYTYSFNLIVVNKYYQPETIQHHHLHFHHLHHHDQLYQPYHQLISNTSATLSNNANPLHFGIDVNEAKSINLLAKTDLKSGKDIAPRGAQFDVMYLADHNRCNISQVIPKSVIEDPYEHDIDPYLSYISQCNERIYQNAKTNLLDSRLREDVRQTLRQRLKDFSITTSTEHQACQELDQSAKYLNCSLFLQLNEPLVSNQLEAIFTECDDQARTVNTDHCWIKPRLLLRKVKPNVPQSPEPIQVSDSLELMRRELNFRQIIPCSLNGFCGLLAQSVRMDNQTSLCSCKCVVGVEPHDVKQLEFMENIEDASRTAVKEICKPLDFCQGNSTYCHTKAGSRCVYDSHYGSRCLCLPPKSEHDGQCIEPDRPTLYDYIPFAFGVMGLILFVSLIINIVAGLRMRGGRRRHYQLNERPPNRPNRSTGVPNPAFARD